MAKSKGSAKKPNPGKPTANARPNPARSDAPKAGRGGIAQPVTPSPALGTIVGPEPLTRAELTKRVWDYIKHHDLQDARDRRQINPDDKLKQVLGKDPVSMFEMTKLINQHVT